MYPGGPHATCSTIKNEVDADPHAFIRRARVNVDGTDKGDEAVRRFRKNSASASKKCLSRLMVPIFSG